MKHSHYKKPVRGLELVDVYRVLELFGVTDQAIGHAIKKLLCPGQRGSKTVDQDVQEAIDTLIRWQEMRAEDGRREKLAQAWGKLCGDKSHCAPVLVDIEPAAEIDDESERQQRIQQSGEMAEKVYPELDSLNRAGQCRMCGLRPDQGHKPMCKHRIDAQ